jgi:signal transduction histidine kinase
MEVQRKDKLTAMGELASGVAHEIRNPLNAISMVAQRYEKEFTPRSGVKEYRVLTRVLKDESARVNTIIQQFLTFARPKRIQTQPVSTAALIDHVAALFRPQAAQHMVTFSVSVDDMQLMMDREQMTQALLNLLQNALQATPKNGTISLMFKKTLTGAHFIVQDTGTGIPDAVKGKIFDLYFTTKSNGTGIGLSITHQIISQHGGTIQVENNTPTGTLFTISLPLHQA